LLTRLSGQVKQVLKFTFFLFPFWSFLSFFGFALWPVAVPGIRPSGLDFRDFLKNPNFFRENPSAAVDNNKTLY